MKLQVPVSEEFEGSIDNNPKLSWFLYLVQNLKYVFHVQSEVTGEQNEKLEQFCYLVIMKTSIFALLRHFENCSQFDAN